MNGEAALDFPDLWMWLVFVGLGLLFILLELAIGVETGLDLVFIGSALVLGGLVTWPLESWILTVIVTSIICVVYIFVLRHYVRKRMAVKTQRTNVDALIGRQGKVLKSIARNADGRVKIDTERWKARAGEDIKEGDEIIVTGINRNTLIVEKAEGGN